VQPIIKKEYESVQKQTIKVMTSGMWNLKYLDYYFPPKSIEVDY